MIIQSTFVLTLLGTTLSSSAGIAIGYVLVRIIFGEHAVPGDHGYSMYRILRARARSEGDPRFYPEIEEELWSWSLNTHYAIGRGLITKEDAALLENGSLAQSNLALGIILPFSLFVWSLASRLHVSVVAYIIVGLGVTIATAALLFVGTERRFRYKAELQSLILGRWKKIELEKNRER